jgi:hypothetical protein
MNRHGNEQANGLTAGHVNGHAAEQINEHMNEEAVRLNRTLGSLSERLEKISRSMEKAQLTEYVNLMHNPWQLIWRNLLAGVTRGIGIALGFTFFAATIIWVLQALGKLNLPIVGDYIADIVRIVQQQLELPY